MMEWKTVETDAPEGMAAEPLSRFLTYRLARVHMKLSMEAARLLEKEAGLSLVQWRVLALIGYAGETTSSEVVRASAMDKGLVSRKVKTLIAEGLVLSRIDGRDSRVQHLRLTARGRTVFEATLPKMRARQRRLRARLSPEELAHFFSALEKLEAAAEEAR